MKVRMLQFSTTFMQVYVRLKFFLLGSSLPFNLKEGPVRSAKVCNKSWVILQLFLTPKKVTGGSSTIYYNYKNRCAKGPKILISTAYYTLHFFCKLLKQSFEFPSNFA